MDLPVWYTRKDLGETAMTKKLPTEQELLKDLTPYGAHADDLARLLPRESEPLERLEGSVNKFDRSTDLVTGSEDWDARFDEEGISGDFMKDLGDKQ